jgi:hypothetical protein
MALTITIVRLSLTIFYDLESRNFYCKVGSSYDECHYAEIHYAICNYAECHYTEYSNDGCHFVECYRAICIDQQNGS